MVHENRIAVVGSHSFIGDSFISYCKETAEQEVDSIGSHDPEWQSVDLGCYDALLFVAGIAHVSTDPSMEKQYFAVNRDLPVAVAKKAKAAGVKHFIYLSSMIIYGNDLPIGQESIIDQHTNATPDNFYGRSKVEAEEGLLAQQDDSFAVAILRLPMVYGEGCKGNFPKLVALAQKLPVFPDIENRRSMIYIGNLCAFIKGVVDRRQSGVFFPQNSEYVSTRKIVQIAANATRHRIRFINIFNPLLVLLSYKFGFLRKLFGSRVYAKDLSPNLQDYNIFTFEQSMERYFTQKTNKS